jgi:hypothetical protein
MSATTALRVQKYQSSHDALATRVLELSKGFQQTYGYTPPFWRLIELATQAQTEMN